MNQNKSRSCQKTGKMKHKLAIDIDYTGFNLFCRLSTIALRLAADYYINSKYTCSY